MSWKDQLRPASFRGVTFGVVDSDVLFGRRNELHEYPLRDEPYAEDLGRKAREFTINAFVIGDNYFSARDALISAIEDESSPGTLVHPTLGTKTVVPKDCRVIFKNTEGGIEYFALTFIEAGTAKFPSSLSDTSYFSSAFATDALTEFSDSFSTAFSVQGYPDFVLSNALTNTNGLISQIRGILGFGNSGSSSFSEFSNLLDQFSNDAPDQITQPATYGQSVTGVVSGLSNVYLNADQEDTFLQTVRPTQPQQQALAAQQRLSTFGDDLKAVPLTTPSRIQEAANQQQLVNLVKSSAAAEMIRISSTMDFPSRGDAVATRENIDFYLLPHLERLADSGDDVSYLALSKARVAMVKDINSRAANLKNVTYIKTFDSVPALVLAYDHYEDASKDQELIDRNHIRNPLFVPGNTNIEVLT